MFNRPPLETVPAPNGHRVPLIYLDHSATTPMSPEVFEAMRPWMTDGFGNPSGAYSCARKARGVMGEARLSVAQALGCRPPEIVFCSGGTESDNLALRGIAMAAAREGRRGHIVTTAIEHKAVLATANELAVLGFRCTVVPVDREGRVDADTVLAAVQPDTILVSVMLANNEVGAIQPVAEIGRALRARGVPFHTDAVQAAAWMDLDVERLNVDMLSLSAHKFYGPKGVGILYVREGTPVEAAQTGGGQEAGRRSGTENVAGAVGLAAALKAVTRDGPAARERVQVLRDRLIDGLVAIEGVWLTGPRERRLPGHVSICVEGAPADTLLLGMDMRGICASSGSACSSGRHDASHVLLAMGISSDQARGALRLTLGKGTTAAHIDTTLEVMQGLIARTRELVTT